MGATQGSRYRRLTNREPAIYCLPSILALLCEKQWIIKPVANTMNSPAPTLHGRLLCASNCAYAITATGHLPSGMPAPYYSGTGFLQPPATFAAGLENNDACLGGTTQDGIVLAV